MPSTNEIYVITTSSLLIGKDCVSITLKLIFFDYISHSYCSKCQLVTHAH